MFAPERLDRGRKLVLLFYVSRHSQILPSDTLPISLAGISNPNLLGTQRCGRAVLRGWLERSLVSSRKKIRIRLHGQVARPADYDFHMENLGQLSSAPSVFPGLLWIRAIPGEPRFRTNVPGPDESHSVIQNPRFRMHRCASIHPQKQLPHQRGFHHRNHPRLTSVPNIPLEQRWSLGFYAISTQAGRSPQSCKTSHQRLWPRRAHLWKKLFGLLRAQALLIAIKDPFASQNARGIPLKLSGN